MSEHKGRNTIAIIGIIAVGIALNIAHSHRDEAEKVQEPSPTPFAEALPVQRAQVKVNLGSVAKIQTAQTSLPNAQPAADRFATIPKDPIVDFKVVDGLAVAYGDTVIGKIPEGFGEAGGLTDTHPVKFWKTNTIAYFIDESVKNKVPINEAIDLFQTRTNLRFIPYTGQEDAIAFTMGKENCMSALGRTGGLQPIYLEPKCAKLEIAHEIMHALGFVHEQSRIDRDQFITILWNNIQEPFQSQFAIVPEGLMEAYGDTPFDPTSILMYNPHIFATGPNLDTMKLKNGGTYQAAPSGLSDIDILRVNRLYRN
jgi:hypothetical protein